MAGRGLRSRFLLHAFLTAAIPAMTPSAAAPAVIPLWPEGVPGAQPGAKPEYVEEERVHNVQVPTLTHYPAPQDRATGTAVIVCPGGAYARLSIIKEGSKVAAWLNSIGVDAFVLKSRLVEYGHPAPLRDVLRAVRLVRSQAAGYGVDPQRIGGLGFSAGGHLAASAGTLYDLPEGRTGAALDTVNARPDFIALIYPVIFMDGPFVHHGSSENLLGKNPAPEMVRRLSVAEHVTAATPPAFLVHTQEDAAVPVENSLAFYTALRRAGVSAELNVFEKGPHGVGLGAGLGPVENWPRRCAEWMRSHGWVR